MQNKKATVETVIRTIILIATLVNQFLTMFGKNPLPFAEDELYSMLTAIATVCATVWAWWKNNSFTTKAIKADEYLAELKNEAEKTEE